ncbi:MAG: serine/threonine-protein kinase [Verrucomicrobiota bacterium]
MCLLIGGSKAAGDEGEPAAADANQETLSLVDNLWHETVQGTATAETTLKSPPSTDTAAPPAESSRLCLRAQEVSNAKAPVVPPAHYEVVRTIGEGGMGTVYEARQTSADRVVAIKVMKTGPTRGTERRERFLSEAAATADLEHPNIVPVYEVATDRQGVPFYVMKRVRGVPWSQVLRLKSLTDNLEVLLRVADAVSFAHSRDVIHRDLKPGNVMLGDYGEVLVLDWGLAGSVSRQGKAEQLKPGSVRGGTPAYMAPELARGDIRHTGKHSDIYLLGAILFEILAGYPPHRDPDVWKSLALAADNVILPTRASGELLRIALKAMAADPAARYPTVKDFQAAIRLYLSHVNSVSIASQAQKALDRATASGQYDDFAAAVFGYREALSLWDGNEAAAEGLSEACRAYAECALRKGDVDLAASLVSGDRAEDKDLAGRIAGARRERDRRRRVIRSLKVLAVSLTAVVVIVVTVAFFWIRGEQALTLAAKNRAEGALAAEEKMRREAEGARASEERLRISAEYDAYVGQVGLAASCLEHGEVLEARRLLAACAPKYRNWEWAYLARLPFLDEMTYKASQRFVTHLAVLPDGRRFITAGANGSLRLWQIGTPQCLRETRAHAGWVDGMAVSPDGKYVASAAGDNRLTVHRADDLSLVRETKLPEKHCACIAFSPDGRTIGVGQEGLVSLYDAENGTLKKSIPRKGDDVTLAFSPDGKSLATGGVNPPLEIYDMEQGTVRGIDRSDIPWVRSVNFSPDGKKLLIAPGFGGALVLDLPSGDAVHLRGHRAPLTRIEMLPDQSLVATASEDTSCILSDPATGQPVRTLLGHTARITALGVCPDGKRLITAGADDEIKVWNIRGPDRFSSFNMGNTVPLSLAFSPGSSLLAVGTAGGGIRMLETATEREASVLSLGGWIFSVNFSPDGKYLLAAGGFAGWGKAWLYDVADRSKIREYQVSNRDFDSAAISPDGKHILMGSRDAAIRLLSLEGGNVEKVFTGSSEAVLDLAFFPDGQHFLSCGRDATRCWEIGTDHEVWRAFELGQPFAVAVSPKDNVFYADGTLYRGVERANLHALRGQRGTIVAAGFSPDGERIATGSRDGSIKIWDVRTGRSLLTLRQHSGEVKDVRFSPSGLLLASAGADGQVVLWRAADRGSLEAKGRIGAALVAETEAPAPLASNLLRNAGFDIAGTQEKKAYAWEAGNPDSRGDAWGAASRESWRGRSGGWEGTICGSWCGKDSGGWWQEVAVKPGRQYRLTAWCYADCGIAGAWTSAWHGATLEFFSHEGKDRRPLGAVSSHFGVLQEQWSPRELSATAPAGASWARLSILAVTNGNEGALQFDDLSLEEVP